MAAATGHREQAGVFSNPELTWEREDLDEVVRQDTWSMSWRLPFDGREHRLAEADAEIAASKAMSDATRLNVRLELRELFAEWYVASEREGALKRHFEAIRRLAGSRRPPASGPRTGCPSGQAAFFGRGWRRRESEIFFVSVVAFLL